MADYSLPVVNRWLIEPEQRTLRRWRPEFECLRVIALPDGSRRLEVATYGGVLAVIDMSPEQAAEVAGWLTHPAEEQAA